MRTATKLPPGWEEDGDQIVSKYFGIGEHKNEYGIQINKMYSDDDRVVVTLFVTPMHELSEKLLDFELSTLNITEARLEIKDYFSSLAMSVRNAQWRTNRERSFTAFGSDNEFKLQNVVGTVSMYVNTDEGYLLLYVFQTAEVTNEEVAKLIALEFHRLAQLVP